MAWLQFSSNGFFALSIRWTMNSLSSLRIAALTMMLSFRSAPAFSSCRRFLSRPAWAACAAAVRSASSRALMSGCNVNRCLRMAPSELAAAWCSGVLPSDSLRFGSPPRSITSLNKSHSPIRAAWETTDKVAKSTLLVSSIIPMPIPIIPMPPMP